MKKGVARHSYASTTFLVILLQTSLALGDMSKAPSSPVLPPSPPQTSKNQMEGDIHSNNNKFKNYLKTKYPQTVRAESNVKQTPRGLAGKIFIDGDLLPTKNLSNELKTVSDPETRVSLIAKAFIDDEPVMLGVEKNAEIRKVNIRRMIATDGERYTVYFKKYLNGFAIEDSNILLSFDANEHISEVQAWMVPVTSEMYEATKKNILSPNEVISIVKKDAGDLNKVGLDPSDINFDFNIYLVSKPPYLIWNVSYVYQYRLNAITGEVIKKTSGMSKNYKPK